MSDPFTTEPRFVFVPCLRPQIEMFKGQIMEALKPDPTEEEKWTKFADQLSDELRRREGEP